jgi:hypothetical protein
MAVSRPVLLHEAHADKYIGLSELPMKMGTKRAVDFKA